MAQKNTIKNLKRSYFIIYDGINNSVFEGQVLKPFQKEAQENPEQEFVIVSFEACSMICQINPNLNIIQFKRLPFLGKFSLLLSILKLKKHLKNIKQDYTIKARGPLAGWICLKSTTDACKEIVIQARGVLVEEYELAHPKTKNLIKNLFHNWRIRELRKIEKETYNNHLKDLKIESVSHALSKYLIKNYQTPQDKIYIAQNDIPEQITLAQKNEWFNEIRKELKIPIDYTIYCYNGSAKVWQRPVETIKFFEKKSTENQKIFLLILTQDKQTFEKLLENFSKDKYKIISAPHNEIQKYLAACNYGIILRDKNIVNWVSRPTKALEYKAAHLKIIHNNTVEYLS